MEDFLEGLKVLGKDFRLRLEIEDLKRMWSELYPNLKIREQLILANNWCIGNPKKTPKQNFIRFLNSWMKSASEWAEKVPQHRPYIESRPHESELLDANDFKLMRQAIQRK